MASVYYDKYDFTCQQVNNNWFNSVNYNQQGFSGCTFEIKPLDKEDFWKYDTRFWDQCILQESVQIETFNRIINIK